MEHFLQALEEVKPAFGIDDIGLQSRLRGGFLNYGE